MECMFGAGSLLAIIICSYLAKRAGVFGSGDYRIFQVIIFNVTLPAAAIRAFASSEHDLRLLWLTAFGFVAALLPLLTVYLLTSGQKTSSRAFQMLNSATFNIGSFALPVITTLMGPAAGVPVIMFDLGNVIMCSAGSQIATASLLRLPGNPIGGETFVRKLRDVASRCYKSTVFVVYVVLFMMSGIGATVPQAVLTLVDPLADANTFLSMAMVGLIMEIPVSHEDYLDLAHVMGWRLATAVVLGACALALLPVPVDMRIVTAITVFAPIPLFACKFTDESLGRGELAGFALTVSAIVSLAIVSLLCVVLPLAVG